MNEQLALIGHIEARTLTDTEGEKLSVLFGSVDRAALARGSTATIGAGPRPRPES